MTLRWVGSGRRRALARCGGQALGWTVHEVTDDRARLRSAGGSGPFLELLRTPHLVEVRHRVHLDVVPAPGDDQAGEVGRLQGPRGGAPRRGTGRSLLDGAHRRACGCASGARACRKHNCALGAYDRSSGGGAVRAN